MPRASVWRAAAHNVATGGAYVAIEFDNLDYDTDGMWATTAPTRLTCRTSGLYAVEGWCVWPTSGTSYRQICILKNGNAQVVRTTPPFATTVVSSWISAQLALVAGDYLVLGVAQNTGGVLTLPANGTTAVRDHVFQACLISTT